MRRQSSDTTGRPSHYTSHIRVPPKGRTYARRGCATRNAEAGWRHDESDASPHLAPRQEELTRAEVAPPKRESGATSPTLTAISRTLPHAQFAPPQTRRPSRDATGRTSHCASHIRVPSKGRTYARRRCATRNAEAEWRHGESDVSSHLAARKEELMRAEVAPPKRGGGAAARRVRHLTATTRHVCTPKSRRPKC